jgi:hypothetical protein
LHAGGLHLCLEIFLGELKRSLSRIRGSEDQTQLLPILSQGSKPLAVADRYDDEVHPEDDYYHMNDEFGKIWLRDFLRGVANDFNNGPGACLWTVTANETVTSRIWSHLKRKCGRMSQLVEDIRSGLDSEVLAASCCRN